MFASCAVNEMEAEQMEDPRYSLCPNDFYHSRYTKFAKRDRKRLNSIIFGDGKLQVIKNWSGVKMEFEYAFKKFFHFDGRVKFVHVRVNSSNPLSMTDESWVSDHDFLIVHGDYFVYLAIPSPRIANIAYDIAKTKMGFEIQVTNYDRDVMSYHGDKDKKLQYPPFSMNFGITARPQKHGLSLKMKPDTFNSIPSVVLPIYEEHFYGVYIKSSTNAADRYHDIRKGCPRMRQRFEGDTFHIPLTLQDTYTTNLKKKKKVGVKRLALLENRIRSMSEYLFCQIFYALPYGMLPIISIENVTRTRDFVSSENAEYFPIPRIFPKGTLGMYPTKSMHDNDNGAATPSIWMSVEGEDSTTLSFHGVDFEISLRATTHRFCWFMGWIPHKSTLTKNPKKFLNMLTILLTQNQNTNSLLTLWRTKIIIVQLYGNLKK